MSNVSFHYVDGIISLVIDNSRIVQVQPQETCYRLIKQALQENRLTNELAKELLVNNVKTIVQKETNGLLTMENDKFFYKGKEVENIVCQKIREFIRQGLPYKPLFNFLENLLQNPSFNSQKETYKFLEQGHFPITEDGYFIGYKAIRANWTDGYSGTLNIEIGKPVWVDRCSVDDDRNRECSYGLHVGTLAYATQYATTSPCNSYGTGIVLLVKVNPKDVVSVNSDAHHSKIRVCEYLPLSVMQEAPTQQLYSAKPNEVNPISSAWSDDPYEWDDEEVDSYYSYDEFDEEDEDEDSYSYSYNDDEEEYIPVQPSPEKTEIPVQTPCNPLPNLVQSRDSQGRFIKGSTPVNAAKRDPKTGRFI